jgi:hypothetical protein
MTPTVASEVLLELPPLHLQLEAEAKTGEYRLNCNTQWKPRLDGFGHICIIRNMKKEPILRMGTNKMTMSYAYDKSFTVRFPNRFEWKDGLKTDKKGRLIWNTDGSKTSLRHWSWRLQLWHMAET